MSIEPGLSEPTIESVRPMLASYLVDTLIQVNEDVLALLSALASSLAEAYSACDHLESQEMAWQFLADGDTDPRAKRLAVLATAHKLSEKLRGQLTDGEQPELIAIGVLMCESLLKRVAGNMLGLELAKHARLKQAAALGGVKSAATRLKLRKAKPEDVIRAANELLATGRAEHEINSILAQRFRVSRDHIGKLRRAAKAKGSA